MQKKSSTGLIIGIIAGLVLLLCCCCILGVYVFYRIGKTTPIPNNPFGQNSTPAWTKPSPEALPELPTSANPFDIPTIVPDATPTPKSMNPEDLASAQKSLKTLEEAIVPENDPIDLAARLGGKGVVPKEFIDPNAPYEVGATKTFWVSNVDTNKNFQVNATLAFRGDNVYFWIEDGTHYSKTALDKVATRLDQKIIPTDREFFGSEWNPGVDGDSHIYVLYAGGLGNSLAGYFSSADELHPDAHPYSNAHEMFLINSDNVSLSEDYLNGTLAHEFQHMIHWYRDKNEETWMNEGFSMLAEHVNRLDAGGFENDFAMDPDLQLTDWGGNVGDNGPHYGASYLFMVYFLDRFGEDATKALVAEKENGLTSVSKVMKDLNILNPQTNQPFTGEEIFRDWRNANILQNSKVYDGIYSYKSYDPPTFRPQSSAESCPVSGSTTVSQFGTQYVRINCPGTHTISFSGSTTVNLLPIDSIPSGEMMIWSNAADDSDSRLTHTFDLSNVTGNPSLDFKVWYQLEKDYDFAFVSASTDGQNWKILDTQTCTTDNNSGNSYGCGWNNESAGWIDESVDLSEYAGQKVTIRFDIVTDAAVNLNGVALDDMRLDAINYSCDFESDTCGWQPEGFARIGNSLPQSFVVSVIEYGKSVTVQELKLNDLNEGAFDFQIGNDVNKVILAVSGTTPFTREKANFELDLR